MLGGIGVSELVIILFMGMFWLVPVMTVIWAAMTLQRLRRDQEAIATRLGSIERLLQASR
jgi:hypothetical protein